MEFRRVPFRSADEGIADAHQFPAPVELRLRIAVRRQPDLGARLGETDHRAGIGAMRDDPLAVIEIDVAEKTLVAPDERAADQSGEEPHDVSAQAASRTPRRGRSRGNAPWPSRGG